MTMQEIRACGKDFLTPADVAKVLGCSPYAINQQADRDAGKLGFPVSVVGRRVKIPRRAFIRFVEGTTEQEGKEIEV